MERVLTNLYRIGAPNRRGTSYTYLLVRKDGNLLIGHQSQPSKRDIGEIEKLGGIDSQWICHQHDTLTDDVHEDLHADLVAYSITIAETDRPYARRRSAQRSSTETKVCSMAPILK